MLDCLIIGGDSPIGRELGPALEGRGLSVAATTRRSPATDDKPYLNLENLEGFDALPAAKTIALVASETRFSVCKSEPTRTARVNVDAPLAIAARALEQGSRVLFFSSIAVHDGSIDRPAEDAEPAPDSEYGKQKRAVETRLDELSGDSIILRPSKVIDRQFPLFVSWLAALRSEEGVEPFDDMFVSPVFIDHVVAAAAALLFDTRETGVFQLSASDQVSYADIAAYIARQTGYPGNLLSPVAAASRLDPSALWLPAFTRLGCARLESAVGVKPQTSWAAIDTFLDSQGAGQMAGGSG